MSNSRHQARRSEDTGHERGESLEHDGVSGWIALTRNQSVNQMIDGILDLPPHKEFNQTELAELAGVSRNSVGNHIDLLVGLGVIETVPNSSPTRYRLNIDSKITEYLIKIDGEISDKLSELYDN